MTDAAWEAGPPRKILLATDLSARCDRALDRAALLAAGWEAELVGLHVLERNGDSDAELGPSRHWGDPARVVEQQLRHDISENTVRITAVVRRGAPADVILRTAEEFGCGLIVTGIARDETLGRFGLGGSVNRLIRRSKVPILIVKQRARRPYSDIVVATDFSRSSRHALRAAMAFFPTQRLSLYHAFETPLQGMTSDEKSYQGHYRQIALGNCAAFLAEEQISDERRQGIGLVAEHGDPGYLVQRFARERGVDLIVLGTHGRGGLLDIVIGSTARNILSSLSCDALVVREPDARVEDDIRP